MVFRQKLSKRIFKVASPYIDKKDIAGVIGVLKSGWLSMGPYYEEFEKDIAEYIEQKYASSVSSGTAGLHLAVKALGLRDGDEVITSPFSFIASSNCLLYERIKPVFVDIEEITLNIDSDKIEKAVTKKTKALLPVHIFGQTAEMDKIMKIARRYKLKVIEDACESLGAAFNGKKAGTFGDVGVFAFYPNKQMTTGEGGMAVTGSKRIYMLINSLRNQGRGDTGDWLDHIRLGYNYRMDEMSAALGITQLKKLDWMIEKRRQIAGWYEEYLGNKDNIITPKIGLSRTHTWFVYVIRITSGKRNEVYKKLNSIGIQVKVYLPVIHLQPFMRKIFGYKKGDFPIAEKVSSQAIALPFYIGLSKDDVKYISEKLIKFSK